MHTATQTGRCPHCNGAQHPVTQCHRVAAVEYHPDGSIKRVEYAQLGAIGIATPQPVSAPTIGRPAPGILGS